MNLSKYKSKIYLFCLKNQLHKSLINLSSKITNLELYNKRYLENTVVVSERDYDRDWLFLSRKVMSPEVIQILGEITINLVRIYEFVTKNKIISKTTLSIKKDSRYFGTVFSVSFFSNIVCANKVCLKDKLIKLAHKITTIFEKIVQNDFNSFSLIKLSFFANNYIKLFKEWSYLDKEYLTYTLAKKYLINEIKLASPLSENEERNQLYLNMFNQEQTSIKNEITYLGDNQLKEVFFELISSINNFNKVEKKLFWLDVDYSLQKEEPELETVLNLFKECKRLMKNLIENRDDLKLEIDNVIDESIISAVLKEKKIDQEFYFEKCTFILEWLGKMQSAANDNNLKIFKDEFEYKINSKTYFYELIPFFFRFVLDTLEIIHEEKEAFKKFVQDLNK